MQRPDPGQKNILGAAFVGTNPISVLFANIFIKTRKDFQARFFTNIEDAYDWIIEYRRKGNAKFHDQKDSLKFHERSCGY